jgi:ligand-binding sensor domain-containing protein
VILKIMYLHQSILYIVLLFPVLIYPQNEWAVYNTINSPLPSNRIEAISTADDETIWLGTDFGLVNFNGVEWNVYDTVNSPLSSSFITTILSEGDNIWVGTSNGIVVYNEGNWIVPPGQDALFISKNIISIVKDKQNNIWAAGEQAVVKFPAGSFSGTREWQPIGSFLSIAVDTGGVIWIGDFNYASHNGLLWEYNNSSWKYHKLNDYDELISSFPYSLIADKHNNIWMGFGGTGGGGVVRINNSGWEIFRQGNSDFPGGVVTSFAVQDTLIWMGSNEGLILFNGSEWNLLNSANSGLPENWIRDLTVDNKGNKWIGTISGGAAVYNENGIVTSAESDKNSLENFTLINYPNPFNPHTKISYNLPEHSIISVSIYNISGELVSVLYEGRQDKGKNELSFNAAGLSSGIFLCRLRAAGIVSGNIYQKTVKIMYLR